MKLLAIDTSTKIGSLALAEDRQLVAETGMVISKGHARFLLPAIRSMLDHTGWTIDQIGLIACAVGPGSFAGLRIGISTAKGLAFATGADTVGVNTLEAMAWPYSFSSMQVCTILDAKKRQVYAALFSSDGQGNLVRKTTDLAMDPGEFLENQISEPTLFVGDGIEKYGDFIRSRIGNLAFFAPHQMCYHRGGAIASLGLSVAERGTADRELLPNYVRPPDAVEPKTRAEKGA